MKGKVYLPEGVEEEVRRFVLETLGDSRGGFNRPHTLAVVYWMKWLLRRYLTRNTAKVLTLAAYFHDVGQSKLDEKVLTPLADYNHAEKDLHMSLGADIARKFLAMYLGSLLSVDELNEICWLTAHHDCLYLIDPRDKSDLRLLAMADAMGQIDARRVTPTLKPCEVKEFLVRFEAKRRPLFTPYRQANKRLDELLRHFGATF